MEERKVHNTEYAPSGDTAEAAGDCPAEAGASSVHYRNVSLFSFLDEAAETHPRISACRFHRTNISYEALRRKAEICAANLRAHGVQPGDRVGIMLPNLPQTMIAFWGVLKAGAVVTMINPLYMEKELLHIINNAGIHHLITIDLCWQKIDKLRDSLGIEKYFITTIADALIFPFNYIYNLTKLRKKNSIDIAYNGINILKFSVLTKGNTRISCHITDPRRTLAILQYTGGTTGLAKGVMLTHFNVAANIQQIQRVLPFDKSTRHVFMAVLPFFHVYGLNTCLVLPTMLSATVVPMARFVPGEVPGAIEKYRVTVLPGAPAVYLTMLQHKNKKRHSLQSLELCISGSAPIPAETVRRFNEVYGAKIIEGYGLSEASPITHLSPLTGRRKDGSIGVPLPDTQARIVDMELGALELAPGKIGELILRGPQVMQGYWNNPDETANVLRNGWLYTGDIAYVDEEGFFYLVDRKKDMIIIAGYNVYPREIDEVLHEHPKVKDAVSIGVSHPYKGEMIKAYLVLKEGEVCGRSEIVSFCRARLASYKVPRLVEFRDELPKSIVGKVLRRVLRAEEESKLKAASGRGDADAAGESRERRQGEFNG
ncbi:MAG: long-chain fatty acid--CoA ligase [Desulfovibrio sp.]|jgi:long-chain acyl-CoA synthetase|nr:long-chain fatty acid--CoA ligase [Desulfovibrio sp.]